MTRIDVASMVMELHVHLCGSPIHPSHRPACRFAAEWSADQPQQMAGQNSTDRTD